MAGLKGLKKAERVDEKQVDIEEFIGGAQKRIDALKVSKRKPKTFERYSFSLTKEVSDQIDKLVVGRGFRVSRSDVVKAAVEHLTRQSDFEINSALKKVINEA